MFKAISAVVSVTILIGCASHTGVVPMGNGMCMRLFHGVRCVSWVEQRECHLNLPAEW